MLERWTELFGYYCTSRKGPRIFIRDLLPTLDRASFLSDLPSFCWPLPLLLLLLLLLLPLLLLGCCSRCRSRSFGVAQAVRLWAKRDAACSFLLGRAGCPALVPLVAPCPMPHGPVAPRSSEYKS